MPFKDPQARRQYQNERYARLHNPKPVSIPKIVNLGPRLSDRGAFLVLLGSLIFQPAYFAYWIITIPSSIVAFLSTFSLLYPTSNGLMILVILATRSKDFKIKRQVEKPTLIVPD